MQGIIKGFEGVIEKYYDIRIGIFWVCGIVFLTGILAALFSMGKNRRNAVYKLMQKVLYITGIICIGAFLWLLGLTPPIEYRYFNFLIFIMAVGFIVLYGMIQCIMYSKVREPLLQLCRYFQYIVFFELFLLAATGRLETAEAVVGTEAVVFLEIIRTLPGKGRKGWRKKQEKSREEGYTKESDYPDDDLFGNRRRQLERFIPILNQQKEEPYAIMISAEWGMGKTSFLKALEKRMKEDCFIWVKAGSEKTVPEIMLEISEQILEILRKNNVYIENGSFIEKYFLAFSDLLDQAGLGFWGKISRMLGTNGGGGAGNQEYISRKLKELGKTIFLVVDDLDRCDREYQIKMFRVIRESTSLTNCKTIFLVDKAMFLTEDCNVGYIEKYVNYTLHLCPVEYEEMAEHFLRNIFGDETFREINESLLNGRDAQSFRSFIVAFPDTVLQSLRTEIKDTQNKLTGKTEKEKKEGEEKIAAVRAAVSEIQKNIRNARKVKNYLKSIKRNLLGLSGGIEQCGAEYRRQDWIKAVAEVEFIKYFLPENFQELQNCMDLADYFKKCKGYAVKAVLGVTPHEVYYFQKREEILNYIIYALDNVDFSEIRTWEEKCLKELREGNGQWKHLTDYIKYAQTYEDFEEILKLYKTEEVREETDRDGFVGHILGRLWEVTLFPRADTQEFLDFSRKLITVLRDSGLTDKQKDICIGNKDRIIRKVLLDNMRTFKNVLRLFFEMNVIDNIYNKFDVISIEGLYKALIAIDGGRRFGGPDQGTDKLLQIEKYYFGMEEELKKECYKTAGIDFETMFKTVRTTLEICKVWEGIEAFLNDLPDTDGVSGKETIQTKFEKFYFLKGVYSFKEEVFSDVDSLGEALEVLLCFVSGKAGQYDSGFSRIVLQVLYRCILIYEQNADWFASGTTEFEEIWDKINRLAETVCRLDLSEDGDSRQTINEIKIIVYRLGCLYSAKASEENP